MVAAITLTPDNDVVGATITIDGTGFTATEDITLTYGGSPLTPVSPISTDGAGAFSGTFIVPASVQGVHSVVATDETLLTDDDDFTVNSQIIITEANITVGGTINFVGRGFSASEVISFTFGGDAIVVEEDPLSSDADGSFSGTYVVEAYPNGSTDLVATDVSLVTDTDSVIIDALLVITEASGIYGDTINVVGSGYDATSLMAFTLNAVAIVPVGGAINSDADGSFTTTFLVPDVANGSRTLVGTDAGAKTDSDTIINNAVITLDDGSGSIGESVVISGHGFTASSLMAFTFGGSAIVVDEDPLSSEATGEFTATITVPTGFDDTVAIVATDASAKTDSINFIIITVSSSEITQNATFKFINGTDLRLQSVGSVSGRERGAIVDIPFSADDVYTTGGVLADFSRVQAFKKVYLCQIIHNPVGLVCSFVPEANNLATGGKIKFWGTDGNELADNSSAITSKTLTVFIRGI